MGDNEFERNEGTEYEEYSGVSLVDFVMERSEQWRQHYLTNYDREFEEYYRLWRAIWSPEDRQRDYERSHLISPALQQAVESSVSELEEATFGRGKWFDLRDDTDDPEAEDIQRVRKLMQEDFNKNQTRKQVSECMINAAVFGTGIAEITLESRDDIRPATRPTLDGALSEYGVERSTSLAVRLKPVLPKNFLIDPVATSIDDAMGVIIDQFVPKHQVETLQDEGVYYDAFLGVAAQDDDIEPDEDLNSYDIDKIRLTKYYGLVPRECLVDAGVEVDDGDSRYVEACVVIANEGTLLKANANPYMMNDRPVVAFQWDIVPGRFWGRGICEKGYMSQKALDTEMRARIDALALTVHPMLAVDSTRLVLGHKPEVKPGKMILTQGPPNEVLQPFTFGNIKPESFNQTGELQSMVQQATGAVDSTGLLSNVGGDAKAGAVSMSLGAVIKRHKRTLINFQESFLIPMVEKTAWRYMQFDPERYGVKDYKFSASSTLGIIAREYEVSQLISLLQTMSENSPLYGALVQSIVDNMNLSNREELVAVLKKASEPNPEAQKQQQAQQQKQMEEMDARISVLTSQANESNARAKKYEEEAKVVPIEAEAELIRASMGDLQDDEEAKDFDRRMQIIDRRLKQKDLRIKEKSVDNQREIQALKGVPNANQPRNSEPDQRNRGTGQPEIPRG